MQITINSNPIDKWHTWFAWHPVVADNGKDIVLVWMKNVNRKIRFNSSLSYRNCFVTEYEIKEVNGNQAG